MNPGKEGQAWILLWDMASIHASAATLAAMRAKFLHVVLRFIPPHSTSNLQPCDVAVFRSCKSCIRTQATTTLARSVLDGTFDEQGMATSVFGHLAQSRTSATRTRFRQLGGVHCVPTATTISARLLQRPTSCTPMATYSRNRSNQSPLPKTLCPWRARQTTKTTRPCLTRQHRLHLS